MNVYAVAKPDAYIVKVDEAKRISEKKKDKQKHEKMLAAAKRFENMCLKQKS